MFRGAACLKFKYIPRFKLAEYGDMFCLMCRSCTRRKARTRRATAATSSSSPAATRPASRSTRATTSSRYTTARPTRARRAASRSGTWYTRPPPSSASVSARALSRACAHAQPNLYTLLKSFQWQLIGLLVTEISKYMYALLFQLNAIFIAGMICHVWFSEF